MQKNTTTLAGHNNSGKTSFILLLKRMLLEKSFIFSKDDFNAYDKYIWSNNISDILETVYKNKKKKEISGERLNEEESETRNNILYVKKDI